MTHSEKLLASMASAGHDAEVRAFVARQNKEAMPRLFRGYTSSREVDVSYDLKNHEPKWRDVGCKHTYDVPVEAVMFNAIDFLGKRDFHPAKRVGDTIYKDLKKLPVIVLPQMEIINEHNGAAHPVAYVAFPCMRPVKNGDGIGYKAENEGIELAMAYLMTKKMPGADGMPWALVSPKDVAEVCGYHRMVDVLSQKNMALLQENLGLDVRQALKDAFAKDMQTAGRVMAMMMAHQKIEPEQLEQEYGHEVLMAACSKDAVNFLRSQVGKSEDGELAQELPKAATYLKSKAVTHKGIT